MKKIEAIVRPAKVGAVCEALEKIGHPGITITEVEGHGTQKGIEQQFRGKTYKVSFMTKGRVQLVVNDEDVDRTVDAICAAAYTGEVGDGKIFIYPVEDAVRIRTRERGAVAV
jgi:nitrogen regulatory protein P-II 1